MFRITISYWSIFFDIFFASLPRFRSRRLALLNEKRPFVGAGFFLFTNGPSSLNGGAATCLPGGWGLNPEGWLSLPQVCESLRTRKGRNPGTDARGEEVRAALREFHTCRSHATPASPGSGCRVRTPIYACQKDSCRPTKCESEGPPALGWGGWSRRPLPTAGVTVAFPADWIQRATARAVRFDYI